MAVSQSPAVRAGRVLAVGLGVSVAVAVAADAAGGAPVLLSPTIWGVTLVAALILLVIARTRGHSTRSILLGLPIVIGGAAAIALGAWDYIPWLTSPAVWVGILVSTLLGSWLVRTGMARPRDVIEGIFLGLLVFGIVLISTLAGIVFFWMAWRPFG